MKTIRWGVIGCGQIAVDKSLPGLLHAQNARLVALSDPLPNRQVLALELAKSHGTEARIFDDYHDLLADPNVDAVYVSLPTGMHAEAVCAAARAKKAILCEKPLGRSAAEVREMVNVARENGAPLMTAYMSRFSDVFGEATRLLRDKAIGQVTFVSAHFSYNCLQYYPPGAPGGWRWTDEKAGGPLLDIGVYLAFGLREMLGETIARVTPMNINTVAPPESKVFDTTAATFQTQSGIPGVFVAAFSHFHVQLEFYGTKGRLLVGNVFNQTPGGRLECHTGEGIHVLDTTKDEVPHFDNYRREFEHFSAALLSGESFRPAPDEALADALLLDALKDTRGIAIEIPGAQEFLAR